MGGQEHSLVVWSKGGPRADDGCFFSILRGSQDVVDVEFWIYLQK